MEYKFVPWCGIQFKLLPLNQSLSVITPSAEKVFTEEGRRVSISSFVSGVVMQSATS